LVDTVKKPINVMIFVPSFLGLLDSQTVESLGYLMFDCFNWKLKGYDFYFKIGKRMNIHDARNNAVIWALENDMDYILWFDDDMVLDPIGKPLFTTLMGHDKDFVAPLFFQRRPPYMPLLFKRMLYLDKTQVTYDNIMDYEKGLLDVDGVGFGCCLTKVDLFKKIPKPWFVMGDSFGEDLFFCERCINAGIKIYCDTTIQVGHIGDAPIAWESTYLTHKEPAKLFFQQKKERDLKHIEDSGGVVDICMPIYHNFEITKTAIESILNNTIGTTFSLKLVVDGADKDIEKYLKEICKHRNNIEYVVNKKSIGALGAANQVFKMGTAPYLCLINNDIEIPANMGHWLHRLVQLCKPDNVGATAPISNYVLGIQDIKYNSVIIGQDCFARYLIPFCTLYKKSVLDKIGLMDERFQLPNGFSGDADLDISLRITEAGYFMVIARDAFVYHRGSESLSKATGSFENVIESNKVTRQMLVDKWGIEKIDELMKISIV
jgi:GT2 family glycosyltransferase